MFDHHQLLPKWLDAMNNSLITFPQFASERHQQFGRNELYQMSRQTALPLIGLIIREEVDLVSILLLLKMIDSVNQESSGG